MGVQVQLAYIKLWMTLVMIVFPICLVMYGCSSCSLRKRSEKAACRGGDVNQCLYVGKYYDDKQGGLIAFVMSYDDDAVRYYYEACKLKSSKGCERMLYIQAHGEGARNPSIDEAEIEDALIAACTDRVEGTCDELWSYMDGENWAQNRSRNAFDKRCTEGNGQACYLLGRMHGQNLAGLQNITEQVLPLYDKACAAGIQDGCTAAKNYRDVQAQRAQGSGAAGSDGSAGSNSP